MTDSSGPNDRAVTRAMTRADIPAGLALCRASGWNQTAEDWEQLVARGGDGCRVAVLDGRVVGTATAVTYEGRFAWIGMVLVDVAARGRGIGRALLEEALSRLGPVPARLDATPKGHPLYLALGFVEERRLCRLTSRTAPGGAGVGGRQVRPMRRDDLAAVAEWDRSVFGAGRRPLLEWARETTPDLALVADAGAGLEGYCLARQGHDLLHVGPVVADDLEVAAYLVDACRRRAPEAPMVIDVPATPTAWTARLAEMGFVEQRPFIRMCRGTNSHEGRPASQWAIFGPEWG
ncbi:MAG TPA: GNAT family N-acetyltransferase [Vicinamibacterales bacterium]|jgi:GNAT superfamily N-acetyltransferase